jgi:hypothetical protein
MKLISTAVAALAVLACARCLAADNTESVGADRDRIERALREAKILDPLRVTVHVSHTCNLRIEGAKYPVADVRELVRSDTSPHGVNRIVVFSPSLEVRQVIPYDVERPLFCRGNELIVYGELTLGNVSPGGNVLVFGKRAASVSVRNVEWSAIAPATRK